MFESASDLGAQFLRLSPRSFPGTIAHPLKENGARQILLDGSLESMDPVLSTITPRELEIIEHTANGHTEADIAKKMGIGTQTVKTYRQNLFRKTGARNAAELVKFSMANMLI